MRAKLPTAFIGLTLALLWAAALQASTLDVEEADLPPGSDPREVNPSASGGVYVSDPGAGAIWQIEAEGAYSRYGIPSEVVDARPGPAEGVWWTDALDGFGRLDTSTEIATRWALGGDQNLGGLAFDQTGGVWLTQYFGRAVYRFDPASTEVCTYTVGAPSHYVLARDGWVWLGNWSYDRIYHLDPDQQQATWWQIPGANATPVGLALDDGGNLWWADSNQGILARLEPDLGRMTSYTLPLGTKPQMIALRGGRVWYTEDGQGTVGALDPAQASGATTTLASGTASLAPACRTLGQGTTAPVQSESGTLTWTAGNLEPSLEAGGFTVYALPPGSSPWGIAASGEFLWATDPGRTKLIRLGVPEVEPNPQVALQKLTNGVDADVAPGVSVTAGEPVTWTYLVTNTGNVYLSEISVTDDQGEAVTCPGTALAPRASMVCTATGTALAGPYANLGTAVAMPPAGEAVTASDPSHYWGVEARNTIFLPLVTRRALR